MVCQTDQGLGAHTAGLGRMQEILERIAVIRTANGAVQIGHGLMGGRSHVSSPRFL
jgi:hypothetical protein